MEDKTRESIAKVIFSIILIVFILSSCLILLFIVNVGVRECYNCFPSNDLFTWIALSWFMCFFATAFTYDWRFRSQREREIKRGSEE